MYVYWPPGPVYMGRSGVEGVWEVGLGSNQIIISDNKYKKAIIYLHCETGTHMGG